MSNTQTQPKTTTTTVTPEMAESWLEKNTHNRPVHDRIVRDYADMMKRKKWILNGEAIIFDETGTLADGQHRLWACLEAKTPFDTVVVRGVSEKAFTTIDTGLKRSAADVLHVAGHAANLNALAAAATLVIKYERGTILKNMSIPRQDVLQFVDRNLSLQEWVASAKSKGWTSSYASQLAAVMFLGSRKYNTKASEFLRKFTSGEDLSAGSPVLALRNRLGSDKRLPKKQRLSLIVLAWNAYVAGRKLSRTQLPRADEFPKIAGA